VRIARDKMPAWPELAMVALVAPVLLRFTRDWLAGAKEIFEQRAVEIGKIYSRREIRRTVCTSCESARFPEIHALTPQHK